mgnify:CR=1 FL=1
MLKRENLPECLPTVSPRYEFNEESGELEEVGIRDDKAFIQSSEDTAFKAVLRRMGYYDSPDIELYDSKKVEFVDDTPVTDDLEEVGYTSYADFLENLQAYAEKKGLPATMSPAEILEDMRNASYKLKEKIKKELEENEKKKSVETSK